MAKQLKQPLALEIVLQEKLVTLKLLKNRGLLDTQELKHYHDLEDMLISGLDKLLKKNKISPKALKTYKIEGNMGKNSTSYKIASAFVQALKADF